MKKFIKWLECPRCGEKKDVSCPDFLNGIEGCKCDNCNLLFELDMREDIERHNEIERMYDAQEISVNEFHRLMSDLDDAEIPVISACDE